MRCAVYVRLCPSQHLKPTPECFQFMGIPIPLITNLDIQYLKTYSNL